MVFWNTIHKDIDREPGKTSEQEVYEWGTDELVKVVKKDCIMSYKLNGFWVKTKRCKNIFKYI